MIQRFFSGAGHGAPTSSEAMQDAKLRLLREQEVFRDLSSADMAEIERMATMTTCKRGRVFYSPGETGEVLFILKKGRVQLHRLTEDGRKLVTGVVPAGSIFGEMPLLSQRMHNSSAEALEDCTLCVMSRSDVEHLVAAKPRLALNIISILAERLAEAEDRFEMQAFRNVPERVATTLLRLAGTGSTITGVSHQQIAESIGAARETVTRVLGDFAAAGLIELGRARITVTDRSGLDQLVQRD